MSKITFQILFDHSVLLVLPVEAYSLGTEDQFLLTGVSSGHHDSSVHLGRVQGPVGDANKGHSLLAGNYLWCNRTSLILGGDFKIANLAWNCQLKHLPMEGWSTNLLDSGANNREKQ